MYRDRDAGVVEKEASRGMSPSATAAGDVHSNATMTFQDDVHGGIHDEVRDDSRDDEIHDGIHDDIHHK